MADVDGPLPPLRVRDEFAPIPTSDWEAQVRQDLGGQSYEARLLWRTDEGLVVKPFFRREDLDDIAPPNVALAPRASWRIDDVPTWPADAIRADLVHEAGGTALHELAWAIAEGVDRIVARPADTTVGVAADRLAFVFAIGSTYFVEIAKLRASRRLWTRAVQAFEADAATGAGPMRLHARTARANKSTLDPSTNLLRLTTEAMAAAIGGADAILVEPHGFAPHLAINVQHLLAEEAHLGATADPAAGSYYVEWLTDALAASAWRLFQHIEAAGGYAEAIRAGMLVEHLAEPRAARQRDVATRRRTLVGVNAYPNPEAQEPLTGPFPADEGEGALTPLRLAQPFEAMRARTVRHAEALGRLPRVHLLTRGDVSSRAARASFCRTLFGCAGFAVSEGAAIPEHLDVLVLCGADDDYPVMAREVAGTLAAPVLAAGRPSAHLDELTAAGVQDFVYAGIDAVAVLGAWQDRLGMAP